MFITCMTKEGWDNASTEDLLSLIKLQSNNVHSIIWDDIREVRVVEPRFILLKAALCKLGFPKETFFGEEISIDEAAKKCIDKIAEYEKTSFTADPENQENKEVKLTAPIGNLKAGDKVNLL